MEWSTKANQIMFWVMVVMGSIFYIVGSGIDNVIVLVQGGVMLTFAFLMSMNERLIRIEHKKD